jgi:hypothetical protein
VTWHRTYHIGSGVMVQKLGQLVPTGRLDGDVEDPAGLDEGLLWGGVSGWYSYGAARGGPTSKVISPRLARTHSSKT